jgi:PAS domain S-box-containing protein
MVMAPDPEAIHFGLYRERLDLALNAGKIGTWEWDFAEDRVTWSEHFEEIHGFARGQLGHSLHVYQQHIHPDDRERVITSLERSAAEGSDYAEEYRLIAPDGAVHYVEGRGQVTTDHSGRKRMIGVCTDTSERQALLDKERRARLAAETSELQYRSLAAAIPQQVWTASPEGSLDYVNNRVTEYFGRTAAEVIGAGWQDFVHPEDLAEVIAVWSHSLATGEDYEVHFRLRRADGVYRWHLGRAIPVRDNAGTIIQWLGTNTDIDEQRKAMKMLHVQIEVSRLVVRAHSLDDVAEELLRTICSTLEWTCAQLWRTVPSEGELRRTAGWYNDSLAPEETHLLAAYDRLPRGVGLPGGIWESGKPAWITDAQTDPSFLRGPLLARVGLRSGFGFPLIVHNAVDGVIELFSRELRVPNDAKMAMAAALGSHLGQFIERQRAQDDLSRALHQLRRLQSVTDAALENLTLPDLLQNLIGKICEATRCDMAVVLLFDDQGKELYPKASFGGPDLSGDLRIPVGESFSGLVAAERKTRFVRDATNQPFIRPEIRALGLHSILGIPLTAGDRPQGVLLVGSKVDRDFTSDEIEFAELIGRRVAAAIENSTLYQTAREAIRSRDRFTAVASHELRNPLTSILGWAAVLADESDPEIREEALRCIVEGARNQARIVDDLMDSTRIREGKLTLHQEEVDLPSIVAGAIRVISPAAEAKGVKLQVEVGDRPASVIGDRNRLQQVVWNLLNNAIKFTPAGKAVRARVYIGESEATITVTDEGAGIAREFLPKVFRAFEQETIGGGSGGLGLGLHIVSTIVKMHGGQIEAHSDGPGTGASFLVRLPLREAGSSPPQTPKS